MVKKIVEAVSGEMSVQEEENETEEIQNDEPQDKDDRNMSILDVLTIKDTHVFEDMGVNLMPAMKIMQMNM